MVRQIAPRRDLDDVEELDAAVEPLWRRRELESAAFEPASVAGSSRGASGSLAAWLGGLVALVGLALVSASPPADVDGVAPAALPSSPHLAQGFRPPSTSAPERSIAELVVVESSWIDPDGRSLTRRLEVAGRMYVRAARVRVTLEGREDRIIRTLVRDVVRMPPRDGPIMPRRFTAAFDLPRGQSGGMWITVTAFDAGGERLGRVRERIEVYPLPPVVVLP